VHILAYPKAAKIRLFFARFETHLTVCDLSWVHGKSPCRKELNKYFNALFVGYEF
jgi:hypothetical protein